ncbi:universal stress protein [Ilumatobacter sp.]|uniref:universal stress protein n=1 Tax=Ilumatobacter sp. TaxID=1967498 RepID=UPI003C37C757
MKVLIAVDETPESREAAEVAFGHFGPDHDYTVASVGRYQPLVVPGLGVGAVPTASALTGRLDDEAQRAAQASADEVGRDLPVDVETATGVGHPGQVICGIAAEREVDMIVIGSSHKGFWERIFDPSTARYIVEHAPCPVLVVR